MEAADDGCRVDGQVPTESQVESYLDFLAEVRTEIEGVLLYGLARESMQPEAERLSSLAPDWMEAMGARIAALGLVVRVSP